MHPHLSIPANRLACQTIADELEQCREAGFINRYLGGCNEVKQRLIMCLRKERVERTARHVEQSRQQHKSPEEAWRRHTLGENEPPSSTV